MKASATIKTVYFAKKEKSSGGMKIMAIKVIKKDITFAIVVLPNIFWVPFCNIKYNIKNKLTNKIKKLVSTGIPKKSLNISVMLF